MVPTGGLHAGSSTSRPQQHLGGYMAADTRKLYVSISSVNDVSQESLEVHHTVQPKGCAGQFLVCVPKFRAWDEIRLEYHVYCGIACQPGSLTHLSWRISAMPAPWNASTPDRLQLRTGLQQNHPCRYGDTLIQFRLTLLFLAFLVRVILPGCTEAGLFNIDQCKHTRSFAS